MSFMAGSQLSLMYKSAFQNSFRENQINYCFYCDVYSVALHPDKQILATASDDRTWKLWGLPNGELILTGHGHSDWVAGCDFHPSYVVFTALF